MESSTSNCDGQNVDATTDLESQSTMDTSVASAIESDSPEQVTDAAVGIIQTSGESNPGEEEHSETRGASDGREKMSNRV